MILLAGLKCLFALRLLQAARSHSLLAIPVLLVPLCIDWKEMVKVSKCTHDYEHQPSYNIIHIPAHVLATFWMLQVATTSARMLVSSKKIRDRLRVTSSNALALKTSEVVLCLSLSRKGAWNACNTRERLLSRKRVGIHFFPDLSLSLCCAGRFSIHTCHTMHKHA